MDEAEADQSRAWKWVVQQKKFLRILWKIGVLGKPAAHRLRQGRVREH